MTTSDEIDIPDNDRVVRLPETYCTDLDLHRDDYRLQAVYFAPNGTAVVTNGQYFRVVSVGESAGFLRWLAKKGVCLREHTAWLVLDSVHRVGFVFNAQDAQDQVVAQWGGKTVPREFFVEEAANRKKVPRGESEPQEA